MMRRHAIVHAEMPELPLTHNVAWHQGEQTGSYKE